jgi:hypothetical protein
MYGMNNIKFTETRVYNITYRKIRDIIAINSPVIRNSNNHSKPIISFVSLHKILLSFSCHGNQSALASP